MPAPGGAGPVRPERLHWYNAESRGCERGYVDRGPPSGLLGQAGYRQRASRVPPVALAHDRRRDGGEGTVAVRPFASPKNYAVRGPGPGGLPGRGRLWCAFLAGLHDLGKASPAFQMQVEGVRVEVAARLQRNGLRVPVQHRSSHAPASHGTVTAATLPDILASSFDLPKPLARWLGAIVGGHHGTFPGSSDVQDVTARAAGGAEWAALRNDLVISLSEILGIPLRRAPGAITNGAAMALAGLVSVADWIGSNTDYFPHDVSPDMSEYPMRAQEQARKALDGLGWRWSPSPGAAGASPNSSP